MCCSLYSPESANGYTFCQFRGITVTGSDYGDEGVVEYVVSELVRCFHGFEQEAWDGSRNNRLESGIIGLESRCMIADALHFRS